MPNRILRDWTDSENIDKLSIYGERFFTRLIMKVDDYGRFTANIKILKSILFPLKTDVRETDIPRWLEECELSGLIALYSVASKEYLQIKNFKQTLRQKNEKYPPPDTCIADDKQTHSRCEHETKRNESETKGKEETAHALSDSNLFRKPIIPSKDDVLQCFIHKGGTREMAKSFYERCDATDWFFKGSPITNFRSMVDSYVSNWNKNLKGKMDDKPNSAPLKHASNV